MGDIYQGTMVEKLRSIPLSDGKIDTSTCLAVMGFTEEEVAMATLYMDEGFNSSLIYLSDRIISSYLTNDTSVHKFKNFYARVLTVDYQEGIDYFEVGYENTVVQTYLEAEMARWTNLTTGAKAPQINGKKYFLVTGKCYKKLLMRSRTAAGEAHLDYYLKLEEAMRMLLVYATEVSFAERCQSLEDALATSQRRAKEETEKKLARQREIFSIMPTKVPTPGCIYMAVTPARQSAAKIGMSTKPFDRLTVLKSLGEPCFEFRKIWDVDDVLTAEAVVHKWFSTLRAPNTREPRSTSAASGWFYTYDGMVEDIDALVAVIGHGSKDRVDKARISLENTDELPSFGCTKPREVPSVKAIESSTPWPPEKQKELERAADAYKKLHNIAKYGRGCRYGAMVDAWNKMNEENLVNPG